MDYLKDEARRAQNIACIRRYVDARTYEERSTRWDLYVEDCTSGAVAGDPLKGKEIARQCTEWNLIYFPDYVFNQNIIFQSEDPDVYVVMSQGTGGIYYPAYGERKVYDNIYFHVFRMRDGRMKDYFEYSNALEMYRILGIPIPPLDGSKGWPQISEERFRTTPYMLPVCPDPDHPDRIPDGDDELRRKNTAVIHRYMTAGTAEERENLWKLYEESSHCSYGALGVNLAVGPEEIRKALETEVLHYPELSYENVMVLHTADPDLYMVMSDGRGTVNDPDGVGKVPYGNKYFHIFRMHEGMIQDCYIYTNRKLLYDALGVELDEIHMPDGWPVKL